MAWPVSSSREASRQVRDEVMSIFMAGYESTAAALGWAWYLLSHHPEMDDKLVAE